MANTFKMPEPRQPCHNPYILNVCPRVTLSVLGQRTDVFLTPAQVHASLEITRQTMRKHRFDSSQSRHFVVFTLWVDSWLISSPENLSLALFFSKIDFFL